MYNNLKCNREGEMVCCGTVGVVAHLQSIARPFGQPRVVFTIDKACDPSPHALIIFAGRYQSVQKIYLSK